MKSKTISLKDLHSNLDMLLTSAQVKGVLNISDATLFRWRKNGFLKSYKTGGTYRYKAADILKYISL